MEDEELRQLSKDDLIEVFKQLSNDLDDKEADLQERDDHIQNLEQEHMKLTRRLEGGGGGMDDMLNAAALETENQDLRDKMEKLEKDGKEWREKAATLQANVKVLEGARAESDGLVKTLRKQLDALKVDLDKEVEKSKVSMRKSQDVSRQKQDTQKQQLQLYEENEQLQKDTARLSEQVAGLQDNKVLLEALITKLADEKDSLQIEKEGAEVGQDAQADRVQELERDLEAAQDKLQEVLQSDNQWGDELEALQAEFSSEVERLEAESDVLRQQVGTLRREVGVLKDSTLVGEKQRHVDVLTKKLQSSGKLVDEMRVELEALSADKKQLAERLISYDENMDQQIYERIGEERELARMLQMKNESLTSRMADCEDEILKEEQRSAELSREVDELSHWKVVYENGHGLQELARHQKKMKEDQRRLGLTLEQMSAQLSDTIESKNLLETAFYKLKIETGKDEDFEYTKLELRDEMKGETAKLRLQVTELEEQTRSLEDNSVKLRKALKNQAATFGEDGFKYAGMTPEQLLLVNEFAGNIRAGRVELPLDNRSAALLKDNRQGREDLRLAQLKINRYELELCGLGDDQHGSGGGGVPGGGAGGGAGVGVPQRSEQTEAEMQGLRVDVRNLLHENVSLHGSVQHMKDEISLLLQQQLMQSQSHPGGAEGGGGGGGGKNDKSKTTDNLTAMLMASNDSLMKENAELRHQALDRASAAPLRPQHQHPTAQHQDQGGVGASQPPLFGQRTPMKRPPKLNMTMLAHQGAGQHTPGGLDSQPMSAAMNMNMTMNTGRRGGGGGGDMNMSLGTPRTPHGKTILSRTVAAMGPLPPEEWAEELKELNGQLIECLEQLFEKEEELNQQREIMGHLESHLVETKQQMSAAYVDSALQHQAWSEQEKLLTSQAVELRGERDDLKLKLKRVEQTLDQLGLQEEGGEEGGGQRDDPDNSRLVASLQGTVREHSRKLTVYEVNEAVLCRKFTTLNEQMLEESRRRQSMEEQFAEMEGVLKRRILFLESYKSEMSPKVARLQGLLDSSVPHKDYVLVENELESLRQDHLHALRRELAARVGAFDAQEKARQVRHLKQQLGGLQADLHESREVSQSAHLELENQKEVTQRALRATSSSSSGEGGGEGHRSPRSSQSHRRSGSGGGGGGASSNHEMGSLVSEMAKFRGDASRLQVELVSREYRLEQSETRARELLLDLEAAEGREAELQQRCDEAEASEKRARKGLLDLQSVYDGGLTREEAEASRKEHEQGQDRVEALVQQNVHLKDMAQIAYDQAQSLADIRDSYAEEVTALRAHLVLHESRTDDDLIIGKLQRQLMATKTAYKAFTRKYQVLRGNMRQRELMQRVLEQRLDQREAGALQLQENSRLEVGALRKALQTVHEKLISGGGGGGGGREVLRKGSSAEEGEGDVSKQQLKQLQSASQFEFHDQLKRILHGKKGAPGAAYGAEVAAATGATGGAAVGTIGQKMAVMSHQIESLSRLTEGAGDRAAESDSKARVLEGRVEELSEDNTILRKTVQNLTALMESTGHLPGGGCVAVGGGSSAASKKQFQAQSRAIATKLLTLSEENRTLKMSSLQHRREVAGLQQEKQHLRAVLVRLEDDLRAMEMEGQAGRGGGGGGGGGGGQQELKVLEGFGFGSLEGEGGELGAIDLDLGLHSYHPRSSREQQSQSQPQSHEEGQGHQEGNGEHPSPLQMRLGKQLSVDTSAEKLPPLKAQEANKNKNEHITKDELLNKNEHTTAELLSSQRDLSGYKRQCEHMQQRLQEAQEGLAEREEAIRYYERMATAENLPLLHPGAAAGGAGAVGGGAQRGGGGGGRGSDFRLMREEQEKLQEAASATIGSMRSLLEDKNREIERMRSKLDKQQRRPSSASASGRGGDRDRDRDRDRDKYSHSHSHSHSHNPSVADRRAEELLARLADEERYASHVKGKGRGGHDEHGRGGAGGGGGDREAAEGGLVQRLMDQIDRADEILQDKVKTAAQLELKLATLHAQREKAEQRCGATLEEMESMKLDMVTLVQQLKESEEKYLQIAQYNQLLAAGGGGGGSAAPIITDLDSDEQQPHQAQVTLSLQLKTLKRKNTELTAAVKSKDDKMKQYRNIIIGLKEEFIKSEEDRAIFEAQHGGGGKGRSSDPPAGGSSSEMETLRDQVVALRDGLRQAKQDIEVAKRAREKLQTARGLALKEAEALESQLGRAESQAGAAQEALQRCRRELEESRKREVRLRQKVKDQAEQMGEQTGEQVGGGGGKGAATDRLMREIEALRTENTILRQRVGGGGQGGGGGALESVSKAVSDALEPQASSSSGQQQQHRTAMSSSAIPRHNSNNNNNNNQFAGDMDAESEVIEQGNGHVLGSAGAGGEGGGGSGMSELRRQLHTKWEAEKRLQRRIGTLETRLKEKVDECKDVGERFRRAQQVISQQAQQAGQARDQHQHQKEARAKSAAAAGGGGGGGGGGGDRGSAAHQVQLEESRQQVFSLEEENERLKRLAMVQLPNELSSVRHRCDTASSRVSQLEQELEEAEYHLKVAKNERGGGGGGGASSQLRASEDRFQQVERLKEQLQAGRKQRLELEASVLDRDSQSLELRFEIEAKEGENIRLRRRLKELESVSRTLQQQSPQSGRPHTTAGGKLKGASVSGAVAGGGGAEAVIESLRQVVDKLKGENERLRRGIGVDTRQQQQQQSAASPSGGGGGGGDRERKLLAQEKKKSARLDEEVRGLQERVRGLEDGGQKLVQRQQQVAALRKQVKSKEDRLVAHSRRVEELEAESAQLKQRLSDSHNRLQQLEMQLATSQSTAASALSSAQRHQQQHGAGNHNQVEKDKELSVLKRQASETSLELQTLKAQLGEARRELRVARDAGTGPTGGAISRATAEEQALLKKLRAENSRLKDELSAFDLDFFEEIENLKFAHSEASKQLQWYEQKFGKQHSRPSSGSNGGNGGRRS